MVIPIAIIKTIMIQPFASKKARGWLSSSLSVIRTACLTNILRKIRKKKTQKMITAPIASCVQQVGSFYPVYIPILRTLIPAIIHTKPAVIIKVLLRTRSFQNLVIYGSINVGFNLLFPILEVRYKCHNRIQPNESMSHIIKVQFQCFNRNINFINRNGQRNNQ